MVNKMPSRRLDFKALRASADFPKVLANDYRPGFKTGLALKDIGLILDLAKDEAYPTPLASTIAELYQDAVEHGLTDEHFTSVVKRYEETAGTSVISVDEL